MVKRDLYSSAEFTNFRPRVRLLSLLAVAVFAVLLLRLWHLQVLRGEYFQDLSENNRLRQIRLASRRGRIYDRNGILLAANQPAFNLFIVRQDVVDMKRTIDMLSNRLNLEAEGLRQKIAESPAYVPALIQRDIGRAEVAYFEEHTYDLPGVFLEVEPIRHYLYGEQVAHLLGYLSEISRRQLERDKNGDRRYRAGDLIGQTGIEMTYDEELRGVNGFKEVEVDAYGREIRLLRKNDSTPGNDIYLTIDWRLQKLAFELLGEQAGSVVAIDPNSGEILALVNRPAFDPNRFIRGLRPAEWQALRQHPRKPLQNRALQGQYPPGSVFKIIMSVAGLEEGIITPDSEIYCPGYFSFGRRLFRDWKRGGHGHVNLHKALTQSCDVYFYQLGNRLGVDLIAKYAGGFGLGQPTGVPLPNEKSGIVPSKSWKKRLFKQPWYPGETISVAIGQGYNLATPMQLAQVISGVANYGLVFQPQIVTQIKKPDGTTIYSVSPRLARRLPVRPASLAAVRNGLRGVVNDAHGTGWRAKLPNIVVAGKTGTSQVVRLQEKYRHKKPEQIPERFRDHSWFVAFAPFDIPKIAIAVFAEHSGKGGSRFAPVARDLISTYLVRQPETGVRQALVQSSNHEQRRTTRGAGAAGSRPAQP